MSLPQRQEKVTEFMRDCFMERLDVEPKFAQLRNRAPTFCWISRFNSLGIILPKIDSIWNEWCSIDAPETSCSPLPRIRSHSMEVVSKRRSATFFRFNVRSLSSAMARIPNITSLVRSGTCEKLSRQCSAASRTRSRSGLPVKPVGSDHRDRGRLYGSGGRG
jgi:hypothetical protein